MNNLHNNKKLLFQDGIWILKNDDSKKAQGPEKKEEEKKTPEQQEDERLFNKGAVQAKLQKQKMDFPDDVYRRAKSILETGTLMEKKLVRRLTNGEITPQRFRLLYKLLHNPEGGNLKKQKLKTQITERYISDREIDDETFELAISAINRANPETDEYEGDLEIVKDLALEKNGPVIFKKKLKEQKALKSKSIEAQEKDMEAKGDEMTPDDTRKKYSGQFDAIERSERGVNITVPENVSGTIEFRQSHEALKEIRKSSIESHDYLLSLFERIAKGDKDLKEKMYDAVFSLFPDVIRKQEKEIPIEQIRIALQKVQDETGEDLQIETHLEIIHEKIRTFQDLRHEMMKHEVKIAEILRGMNTKAWKEMMKQMIIENSSEWVGIPLRKGQKIVYNTKTRDLETDKIIEGREEAEIMDVKPSDPTIYNEEGQPVGERGFGTVMITVSGIGTIPEGVFRKWVDDNDACAVVKTVAELEEITGFKDFGVSIEKGLELTYEEMTGRDEKGEVLSAEKVVKVEEISDEEVGLDQKVITLHREEAERIADRGELDEDREDDKLTLGQFAKWVSRKKVVPNPRNTAELQKMTDALEEVKNKKYPSRNPSHYVAPTWTAGTTVFSDTVGRGTADRHRINEIDEARNRIVMDSGELTRAAAVRTARKQELQTLDPEVEANRQTALLGDNPELQASEQQKVQDEMAQGMLNDVNVVEDGTGTDDDPDAPPAMIPESGGAEEWADVSGVPGAKGEALAKMTSKRPSKNFFLEVWKHTNLLSIQDLWEFGKAAYEYHVRRWGRAVKNNYANVGRNFPYIGTEMDRVKQSAENEEVDQFKQAMENWGVWQIEDTLYKTGNKDQAKACLIVLSSKGQLRWEDVRLWKTLNRFVDKAHFIPEPPNDDFTAQDKFGKTGMDYLSPAVDFLWGEGQHSEWFNQNNNTFEQNKKSFHHKGDQLEGDPKNIGGVTAELGKLLAMHKMGYYIDAQEYEGLIDFIIHKGKSSAEAKLYYLIEGCAAKNSRGQTILPWDRIGNLDGEYLNRLPMLDYMTDKLVKKPFQEEARPWKRGDFEKICEYWDGGKGKIGTGNDGNPPHKAFDFMWAEVLRHPWVMARNNKGLRNAEQIDHDDAHVIVPLASEDLVQNICGGPSGMKKYFTEEGITNAYPGYNRFMKTLADYNDVPKLLATLRGFVRYDSIIGNRYLKEQGDRYTRVSETNYYRRPIVDKLYVADHRDQLQNALKNIAKAYDWDISLMFEETKNIKTNKEERAKQQQIEDFIGGFGKELESRVMSDGGKKLIQAVRGTHLTGMADDLGSSKAAIDSAIAERRSKYDEKAKMYGVFGKRL